VSRLAHSPAMAADPPPCPLSDLKYRERAFHDLSKPAEASHAEVIKVVIGRERSMSRTGAPAWKAASEAPCARRDRRGADRLGATVRSLGDREVSPSKRRAAIRRTGGWRSCATWTGCYLPSPSVIAVRDVEAFHDEIQLLRRRAPAGPEAAGAALVASAKRSARGESRPLPLLCRPSPRLTTH